MQSNDIDIAVENIMGVAFAEFLVTFASQRHIQATDVAKVKLNPDNSKHLETAKTTIMGVDLDFANLRSEKYAEASRIPSSVVCAYT